MIKIKAVIMYELRPKYLTYLNEENPDKNMFFQKKKIMELSIAINKTNKKR